ncbi:MAG: hypothetical protein KC636_33160 [Myxococcales bacterium]|nr:hypothetical protein [Myxococcales bacterium]
MRLSAGVVLVAALSLLTTRGASADEEIYSPHEAPRVEKHVIDMHDVVFGVQGRYLQGGVAEFQDLSQFGDVDGPLPEADPDHVGSVPEGWVQAGGYLLPEPVAKGEKEVSPNATEAWEDIEGNQYPRKHTVFLNFAGATLAYGGVDNSAENRSSLAKNGPYPSWGSSEASALAVIQSVVGDMAPFGIRVVYEKRPSKTIPYTMAMVGGSWTDTNLDSPAGGVASSVDCEARNQRHIVYAFGQAASSVVSQELAHAWGLDHIYGSDMIMSYQGFGNKDFATTCRDLCEEGCQGANTIGCREIHEKYCGVDSEQQNDTAELNFVFGGNEPDTQPPTVAILKPADGEVYEPGVNLSLAGEVHDDYGGVGWKLMIEKDGELVFDEVDYDRALSWDLNNLPEGTYKIILEAEDHADHVVQDVVTIYVTSDGEPPETTGTTGDPTTDPTTDATTDDPTDGSTTAGTTGDDTSGDPTGVDPTAGPGTTDGGSDTVTAGMMDEDEGCGCRARGPGDALAAPGLLLLALGLRRRRRTT